jgi:hypothetical protein
LTTTTGATIGSGSILGEFTEIACQKHITQQVGIVACEEIITSELLEALRLNSSHFKNEISLMDSCIRHIDD